MTGQCGRCGMFIGDCMPTDCPGDMRCKKCDRYLDQCSCEPLSIHEKRWQALKAWLFEKGNATAHLPASADLLEVDEEMARLEKEII